MAFFHPRDRPTALGDSKRLFIYFLEEVGMCVGWMNSAVSMFISKKKEVKNT
jgi:hypothetical protein